MTILTLQLLYLPLSSSMRSSSVLPGFTGPTHTLKCGSAPTDSRVWLYVRFVCLCVWSVYQGEAKKKVDMRKVERLAAPYLSYLEGGISIFKAVENS